VWRHKHPGEQKCTGCDRTLAVRDGYCRLCWQQTRYEAQLAGGRKRGAVAILASAGRLGTVGCRVCTTPSRTSQKRLLSAVLGRVRAPHPGYVACHHSPEHAGHLGP